MIVCHCNRIDHSEIERAADKLADGEVWNFVTPVAVYKALGKRPRCGGCLPLAASLIHARHVCPLPDGAPCPLLTSLIPANDQRNHAGVGGLGVLEATE